MLTETALTGDSMEYAIVGIGLNVNVDFASQPELAGLATSLLMETGQPIDRLAMLRVLVERFAAWYTQITMPQLQKAWAARLVTLGQMVHAQTGDNSIDGMAEAVDADGALLVRTPNGSVHRLLAGDVTLHGKKAV
jgi:BirA family biotin operon repressor/biotin-[acetyl-CoA-carboxylase] ligase